MIYFCSMPRRKNDTELTEREKMFCAEYLTDFDAKNAAIRAGYSEKTAASQGAHILQREVVGAHIRQLQATRFKKLEITAEMVFQEMADIAFAKVDDFVALGGADSGIKPGSKIPAAVSHRIVKVNADTGVKTTTHFSLKSKIDALKALGHNLGMFNKENEHGKIIEPLILTPRNKRTAPALPAG